MNRKCQVCARMYDPATVRQGVPQGLCSRTCQQDRARLRANDRASRRRIPPRAPSRLFTPSSRDWTEARAKVEQEATCRVGGVECSRNLEAAHIIPRSLAPNGGEDGRNIVPLCGWHHALYDRGELDMTPYLTAEEQGFAVELAGGIFTAMRVLTGKRPEEFAA